MRYARAGAITWFSCVANPVRYSVPSREGRSAAPTNEAAVAMMNNTPVVMAILRVELILGFLLADNADPNASGDA